MQQTRPRYGAGTVLLALLVALGVVLAMLRYVQGLGAVTNLSDAYPWGLWIGFDVLCGVALAASGFVMAAVVYLFRLERYQPIVRPAVLTAFLGYLLVIVALLIDLGRYYRIWHPLVMWQSDSVMFEVGWCVTLYAVVLALEFVPSVLERYNKAGVSAALKRIEPIVLIILLAVFAAAMTHSIVWTVIIVALFLLFQILVWTGIFPDDRHVAPLLIIAGVILSTLHQSSLGSLFLIVPTKLSALWYTPMLPVMFFVSAVAVGPAMVIFESIISSKVFKRGFETDLLSGIGRALPYILGVYLLLKVADLVGRNAVEAAFTMNLQSVCLWLEVGIGIVLPMTLLATSEIARSVAGLFWSSLCVIVGVVLNRVNVSMIGVSVTTWEETYIPSWMEFAVTVGVVAAGVLLFSIVVRNFPIYEDEDTAISAS